MSLVVASLLWAVVGADEYVGASMPQYGALGGGADYVLPVGDDYRASVPAAPHALPDYKYHEDASGNADIPTNDIDTETWKKPPRKQRDEARRQRNEVGAEVESMGEPLSKGKGSRRRGRARALDGGARGARRARSRSLDAEASPPLIDYEDKPTFRKNTVMEDDDRFRDRRETTERIVRRKPRDRYERPLKSDELDFEEELDTDKKLKEVIPNEYPDPRQREWNRDMPRATRPRSGGALDLVPLPPEREEEVVRSGGDGRGPDVSLLGVEEDEDLDERLRVDAPRPTPPAHPPRDDERTPRSRTRHYDYGDNYYDMKRVMNIKNKLPSLMRRPTTRARGAPSSSPKAFSSARPPPSDGTPARTEAPPPWLETPARSSSGGGSGGAGASELFELLYPVRRAGAASPPSPHPSPDPAPAPTLPPPSLKLSPPPAPRTSPAGTSHRAVEQSSELTLLERSRLSILKKAQKKEGWGAREASHKPPVLLQVTSKVPTVVMVEPATSAGPWARARPVSAHSPRHLEKVKRLMRRKLIANARSIQDLTDNWDDMVCDYIDTSLLDEEASRAAPSLPAPLLVLTLFLLC